MPKTPEDDIAVATSPDAGIMEFTRCLRVLRRRAGDPPYRKIARASGYSLSTITRALNGQKLPKWPVVEAMLTTFNTDAGTKLVIKRKWCAVADMLEPLGEAGELPDKRAGDRGVCGDCGALVVDVAQHERWHAEHVRIPNKSPELRVLRNAM